jgi:hypothetical protein
MSLPLQIVDLKPGDIIVDNSHSGIYVGPDEKGHCIVNALFSGRVGKYDGANVRNTSPVSFLKACNTRTPSIFRCKNKDIIFKVVEYAKRFSEKKDIPYSWIRLLCANDFKSLTIRLAGSRFSPDILNQMFRISGLFRAIKFAARRDTHLTFNPFSIEEGKIPKGLRCASLVCLIVQIAALDQFVEPVKIGDWVSTKYFKDSCQEMLAEKIGSKSAEAFLAFKEKSDYSVERNDEDKTILVQKKSKRDDSHDSYECALSKWSGERTIDAISDDEFEKMFGQAFMVDAKYVTARDLYGLLKADAKMWQMVGNLENNPLTLSPTLLDKE